jgi:cyanosortase A-associated protein
MDNSRWQTTRLSLLALTVGSFVAVLGKVIAFPSQTIVEKPPSYPETVPLQGWQWVNSTPLKPEKDLPTGQQYEYRRDETLLKVETRSMLGDGNISRFLFVHTPIRAANVLLQERYQRGIGFYGVLAHEGRAYLTACVNPRGKSTVKEQQFMQNRYTHDLNPRRILFWALGQEPLLDQRCLWTLMSVPLPEEAKTTPTMTETAYKQLESAWFVWNPWWQSHFPPS